MALRPRRKARNISFLKRKTGGENFFQKSFPLRLRRSRETSEAYVHQIKSLRLLILGAGKTRVFLAPFSAFWRLRGRCPRTLAREETFLKKSFLSGLSFKKLMCRRLRGGRKYETLSVFLFTSYVLPSMH